MFFYYINRVSFYMQIIWIGMFCQSGNYMNRGCIQSSSGTPPPKNLPTIYVLSRHMKKKKIRFLSENFQFLVVKFSIYLNRRVFVMRPNYHSYPYKSRSELSQTNNESSDYYSRFSSRFPFTFYWVFIIKGLTALVGRLTLSVAWENDPIRKTYLYNFEPHKPHLY